LDWIKEATHLTLHRSDKVARGRGKEEIEEIRERLLAGLERKDAKDGSWRRRRKRGTKTSIAISKHVAHKEGVDSGKLFDRMAGIDVGPGALKGRLEEDSGALCVRKLDGQMERRVSPLIPRVSQDLHQSRAADKVLWLVQSRRGPRGRVGGRGVRGEKERGVVKMGGEFCELRVVAELCRRHQLRLHVV